MNPPGPEELEVTVFGPGFGECVLVHLGLNRWAVIDSCISSETERPAALSYFEMIGVDPAIAVKLIIATHWHDDHVGGISDLLLRSSQADFSCAAALHSNEFLELMAFFNKDPLTPSSGLSEIRKIFLLLKERGRVPNYAIGDKPLLRLPPFGRVPQVIVTALSPVNAEYHRFLHFLAQFAPQTNTTKRRFPDPASNDLSVATWVQIGTISLLLGADLEEHGTPARGWSAVLASGTRPQGQAAFFKVAHHGSVTGHHADVWTRMLTSKVTAVLTPWNKGQKLPQRSDCHRIDALAGESYATSRAIRQPQLSQTVQKTLRESRIKVTAAEPATGFVRVRSSLIDPVTSWDTSISPEACRLRDY
jgi:Metallo-beta-lactamase superfamily